MPKRRCKHAKRACEVDQMERAVFPLGGPCPQRMPRAGGFQRGRAVWQQKAVEKVAPTALARAEMESRLELFKIGQRLRAAKVCHRGYVRQPEESEGPIDGQPTWGWIRKGGIR